MPTRTIRSRLRDLAAYVAIGVAFVAVIVLLARYGSQEGAPPSNVLLNWLSLGGVMAIVYVTAVHHARPRWKTPRFWSGLMLAFLAQIGLGILVLSGSPRISVWVWGLLLYPANTMAVERFLDWWIQRAERRRRP